MRLVMLPRMEFPTCLGTRLKLTALSSPLLSSPAMAMLELDVGGFWAWGPF